MQEPPRSIEYGITFKKKSIWPLAALSASTGNWGVFLSLPWWPASAAAYVLYAYLACCCLIAVLLWLGYTPSQELNSMSKLAIAISISELGYVIYALTRPMH